MDVRGYAGRADERGGGGAGARVAVIGIDGDQFAKLDQRRIEILHAFGHDLQAECRTVVGDEDAIAVVDQTTRGCNRLQLDAVAFGTAGEFFVLEQLELRIAPDDQHHREDDQREGLDRARTEQQRLGKDVLDG